MYTLNLDNNNYILSIAHTKHDCVELDLSTMDLNYLSCYKYENNSLSFDEEKKAQVIAEREAEEKAEEHEKEKLEQTNKFAERFVASGENSDDFADRIDAQVLYTALLTDSIIDEEE